MLQGHVEAYGSYEEILARGVELMQLIKARDKEDDREIFSVHEEDEDEEEEEEGGRRGRRGKGRGRKGKEKKTWWQMVRFKCWEHHVLPTPPTRDVTSCTSLRVNPTSPSPPPNPVPLETTSNSSLLTPPPSTPPTPCSPYILRWRQRAANTRRRG